MNHPHAEDHARPPARAGRPAGLDLLRLRESIPDGSYPRSATYVRPARLDFGLPRDEGPDLKRRKIDGSRTQPAPTSTVHTPASAGPVLQGKTLEDNAIVTGLALDEPQHAPFPVRPNGRLARRGGAAAARGRPPTRPTPGPVSSKPWSLEAPKSAPRLASSVILDVYPWRGCHREDTLNETTIKSGFFDKMVMTANETASARPAIWSCIKHKSGLQLLSSLFAITFQERKIAYTYSGTSTSKPPPRVTLTDTRREAWLKDLADTAVPLRRLSRTIPHGIRGKALLEQCRAKKILPRRAIWLIKCVGANEIRATKRKGLSGQVIASGETKWIREWTISVEQFLNDTISARHDDDWAGNITYCADLIGSIYAEELLDANHFFDWLLTTLAETSLDVILPRLWLFELFLVQLLSRRRWASRLISILVGKLQENATIEPLDDYRVIQDRLRELLLRSFHHRPGAFLMPKYWPSVEGMLIGKVFSEKDPALSHLRDQNSEFRYRGVPLAKSGESPNAQLSLLQLLDRTPPSFDFAALESECCSIMPEEIPRVLVLVRWACSRFRLGRFRVYIAIRLLRRWCRRGLHLEETIGSLLQEPTQSADLHREAVFRLVTELVRSGHFAVSRYMQWLLACTPHAVASSAGSKAKLSRPQSVNDSQHANLALSLLHHVPSTALPPHTQNLLRILVGPDRTSPPAQAAFCTDHQQRIIRNSVAPLAAADRLGDMEHVETPLALANWMRSHLAKTVAANADALTFEQAHFALDDSLQYTEPLIELKDFTSLADILTLLLHRANLDVLIAISDILCVHFEELHAIGAADAIFHAIFKRLKQLGDQPYTALLPSLSRTGRLLPRQSHTVESVEKEIYRGQLTFAADSPVADLSEEVIGDDKFIDELILRLMSGTSMDRMLLSRLFADVVTRLDRIFGKDDVKLIGRYFSALACIRHFDAVCFEQLLLRWLADQLSTTKSQNMVSEACFAVAHACIQLDDLLLKLLPLAHTNAQAPWHSVQILQLLLTTGLDRGLSVVFASIFRRQVRSFVQQHPEPVAVLIGDLINIAQQDKNQDIANAAAHLFREAAFRELLLELAVHDSAIKVLQQALAGAPASLTILACLDQILFHQAGHEGLAPDQSSNESNLQQPRQQLTFKDIVLQVDELNVGLGELRLAALLPQNFSKGTAYDLLRPISTAIVDRAMQLPSTVFSIMRLVRALPSRFFDTVHALAASRLFKLVTHIAQSLVRSDGLLNNALADTRLQGLCACIQEAAARVSPEAAANLFTSVAERMGSLVTDADRLAKDSAPSHPTDNGRAELSQPGFAAIDFRLSILVRLIDCHLPHLESPKASQQVIISLALDLGRLLSIPGGLRPITQSQLYATLTLLSDHCNLDTLSSIAASLDEQKIRPSNFSLTYLFDLRPSRTPSSIFIFPSDETPEPPVATDLTADLKSEQRVPFHIDPWERLSNTSANPSWTDTCIDFKLFETRRAIL